MILQTFQPGKDYQTYPESEYIRNKRRGESVISWKPFDHMIFQFRSNWYYDQQARQFVIEQMLAYNSGVFISFGTNQYKYDLIYEDLDNILHSELESNYLKIRMLFEQDEIILSTITVETDHSEFHLNPLNAIVELVQSHAAFKIIRINDDTIKIIKLKPGYPIYLDFTFETPNYSHISIKDIDVDDTSIKILLFNTPKTMIVKFADKFEVMSTDYILTMPEQDRMKLLKNPENYSALINTTPTDGSKHLVVYLDPIFYDGDPNSKYVAIKYLHLKIEPIESAFINYHKRAPNFDFISLGTFHRFNDNLWRFFRNSRAMPAFTEHTIYKDRIHLTKSMSKLLEEANQNITGDYEYYEMNGPYNLAYLYDVYEYEYPYNLTTYRLDFEYCDYANGVEYDDNFMMIEYQILDRDKLILENDFEIKKEGKVFVNRGIELDFEYPIIFYNYIRIPKQIYIDNIKLDFNKTHVHYDTKYYFNTLFKHKLARVYPNDTTIQFNNKAVGIFNNQSTIEFTHTHDVEE